MNKNVILVNDEIREKIVEELSKCKFEVNIVTAYCKISTLTYLDNYINVENKKRLLVRFLPSDIKSGSTDKEIYDYCLNNGWELYFDFNVHAKTYVFDRIKCVIGSSNLTNKGLAMTSNSNIEAASYFKLNDDSYKKVVSLYKEARLLSKDVYNQIIECNSDEEVKVNRVILDLDYKIQALQPEDFPNNCDDLIELYTMKSYIWLKRYLYEKKEKFAFFGELTKEIHNIFIDDPRPYRKNIKHHLNDLLDTIVKLEDLDIKITRPNHSRKVELLNYNI